MTTMRNQAAITWAAIAVTFACALACAFTLFPASALASTDVASIVVGSAMLFDDEAASNASGSSIATVQAASYVEEETEGDQRTPEDTSDKDDLTANAIADDETGKLLEYDRSLIDEIGTQEKTGHTICCPSFSCAYADAVIDGTVNDHSYYTCSCCTWTDWGGGGSSNRYVGTDTELLREAYDQISKGKPTVIHVAGVSGEHWIALIGYVNAQDPDNLTLSNFIALDPWDGAQINASARYSLYGDGCEHISSR